MFQSASLKISKRNPLQPGVKPKQLMDTAIELSGLVTPAYIIPLTFQIAAPSRKKVSASHDDYAIILTQELLCKNLYVMIIIRNYSAIIGTQYTA